MINYEIDNMFGNTFKYIISKYLNENKINKDTIIIYPGISFDILEIDNVSNDLGLNLNIIVENNIDKNIIDKIKTKDLILIPSFGFSNLIDMANDMKLEINNSIVVNLFNDKLGVTYYYKEYAKLIYDKYNDISELVIDLNYPFLFGIVKYYKMKNEDIKIIGIKGNIKTDIIDYDLIDLIIDDINSYTFSSKSLYIKY